MANDIGLKLLTRLVWIVTQQVINNHLAVGLTQSDDDENRGRLYSRVFPTGAAGNTADCDQSRRSTSSSFLSLGICIVYTVRLS